MAVSASRTRLGRFERPALTGVLMREIVNFSSYWRSTTFSSTVEPTLYLLAFGFGFGSLVSRVNGYEGERRPANLEDVFVLLTGEEIS